MRFFCFFFRRKILPSHSFSLIIKYIFILFLCEGGGVSLMYSISAFALFAFVLCVALIPLVIHFCRKFSLYDSVNARKIHSGNIPRLGSAAVVPSFFIALLICLLNNKLLSLRQSVPLIVAGSLIFLFGLLDDVKDLRAVFKLLVQLVACACVVLGGYRFRQIFGIVLPKYIGMIFTFCWILGIVNAYNLIDGMDGLCGVLSFTALVTIGILLSGSFAEGTAISLILAASIAGFLVYNLPLPNARIFLGDGGSQFLGFMIATIPLYTTTERFEYTKFLIMLVIVSFPMMDTIAAIWRRIRDHRPVMSPDKYHLHHKLLNIGFNKVQALAIVSVIQIFLCAVVIFASHQRQKIALVMLVCVYFFMICFFSAVHYVNKAVTRRILDRDRMLRR